VAAAAICCAAWAVRTGAEPPAATPPGVVDLGRQRYRIGRVKVDRARRWIAARGVVLRDQPPLEYVAVARKGAKAYESLLELAAEAVEFNLGCILIGLDAARAKPSERHFDSAPVTGDAVTVAVSWRAPDGTLRQVDAADLVKLDETTLPRAQWVYTGSVFLPGGEYAATAEGPLVGFVHDPAPVIEHRTGLLERFGDAVPNPAVAPPVGTRVTLRVTSMRRP
jgi:hypothetical protein